MAGHAVRIGEVGKDNEAAIAWVHDHMLPHGIGEIGDQPLSLKMIAMVAYVAGQAWEAPPHSPQQSTSSTFERASQRPARTCSPSRGLTFGLPDPIYVIYGIQDDA